MNKALFVFSALLIFNLLDALTTMYAIYRLSHRELNPLMHSLLSSGPTVFWLTKFFIVACCGGVLTYFASRGKKFAWVGLCSMTLLYAGLATSNILQILKPLLG